jgi:hypothetical protein
MRDDNTEPRDNQQIADDSQQSEIDMTQREAEEISGRAPEDEPDTSEREIIGSGEPSSRPSRS